MMRHHPAQRPQPLQSTGGGSRNVMGLRDAVLHVCDEIGGSVVQHSDGSVHIMHCPNWSARATALLCCRCPSAIIGVRSSVSSLSGFVIVAQQRWRAPVRPRMFWRLCIAAMSALMLYCLIWTLFGMRFDLSMTSVRDTVKVWGETILIMRSTPEEEPCHVHNDGFANNNNNKANDNNSDNDSSNKNNNVPLKSAVLFKTNLLNSLVGGKP